MKKYFFFTVHEKVNPAFTKEMISNILMTAAPKALQLIERGYTPGEVYEDLCSFVELDLEISESENKNIQLERELFYSLKPIFLRFFKELSEYSKTFDDLDSFNLSLN